MRIVLTVNSPTTPSKALLNLMSGRRVDVENVGRLPDSFA
jgi:hypothetical protein